MAAITLGGATASADDAIGKEIPAANAPKGLTAPFGQTVAAVTLTNRATIRRPHVRYPEFRITNIKQDRNSKTTTTQQSDGCFCGLATLRHASDP